MATEFPAGLPRLGVAGCAGRMGRMLVETVAASEAACLSGATEQPGHEWVGTALETHFANIGSGVIVHDNLVQGFADVDAILDFTSPGSTVANARFAAEAGIVHVIGTTGMNSDDLKKIAEAANSAVIVRAGNMSLGVNLLVQLTKTVARALDDDFDIEIVETHHRHKVDAPSGTALMLGDAAAAGRGLSSHDAFDRARDGHTGPRTRGNIGFSAIRGGDVVGEHDVVFVGIGERIVLRHIATDRAIFAQGAIKAALWGVENKAGDYDMNDVLRLKG